MITGGFNSSAGRFLSVQEPGSIRHGEPGSSVSLGTWGVLQEVTEQKCEFFTTPVPVKAGAGGQCPKRPGEILSEQSRRSSHPKKVPPFQLLTLKT